MEARLLGSDDAALLEDFLRRHRDGSMFLRSNLRRAGLIDRGQPLEATYAGTFHEGALVGVAAHAWNGLVLLQAPAGLELAVRSAVAQSKRAVSGLSGPQTQVQLARAALGLSGAATRLNESEGLYALDLAELRPPEALRVGYLECRPPHARELPQLREWRIAFAQEALGAQSDTDSRKEAELLDAEHADGNLWVALHRGSPVAMASFNAVLPDIVQLGGVYTPPVQRGRGFAQAVVAASLLTARERGQTRAVAFTANPSAIRSYERVGFRRVSEHALLLFAQPEQPPLG